MSTAAQINLIRAAARQSGATLPPVLSDELARLDVNLTPTANTRGTLAEAVTDAVLAGREPAADKRVQAALLAHHLATVNPDTMVRDVLEGRRADVVRRHAPQILAAFAAVVEATQATVSAARDAGVVDYSETGARRLTPDALPLWGRVRESVARADAAVQGWVQLAMLVGHVERVTDSRVRALVLTELSASELDTATAAKRIDARTLAEDGHALSLPTFEEWHARLARITSDVIGAQRDREQVAAEHRGGGHW